MDHINIIIKKDIVSRKKLYFFIKKIFEEHNIHTRDYCTIKDRDVCIVIFDESKEK